MVRPKHQPQIPITATGSPLADAHRRRADGRGRAALAAGSPLDAIALYSGSRVSPRGDYAQFTATHPDRPIPSFVIVCDHADPLSELVRIQRWGEDVFVPPASAL
jgi:hypothetical protein